MIISLTVLLVTWVYCTNSKTLAVIPRGYKAKQNTRETKTATDVGDVHLIPKCFKNIRKGITNPQVFAPSKPVNDNAISYLLPTPIDVPKHTATINETIATRMVNSFREPVAGAVEPPQYIRDMMEDRIGKTTRTKLIPTDKAAQNCPIMTAVFSCGKRSKIRSACPFDRPKVKYGRIITGKYNNNPVAIADKVTVSRRRIVGFFISEDTGRTFCWHEKAKIMIGNAMIVLVKSTGYNKSVEKLSKFVYTIANIATYKRHKRPMILAIFVSVISLMRHIGTNKTTKAACVIILSCRNDSAVIANNSINALANNVPIICRKQIADPRQSTTTVTSSNHLNFGNTFSVME